jgi:hypothetical protein
MIDPSNTSRYYSVDTLYSVCEAGLFRQMVDYLEQVEVDVSFVNLFIDVRETTDRIHRNGMLKGELLLGEKNSYLGNLNFFRRSSADYGKSRKVHSQSASTRDFARKIERKKCQNFFIDKF